MIPEGFFDATGKHWASSLDRVGGVHLRRQPTFWGVDCVAPDGLGWAACGPQS